MKAEMIIHLLQLQQDLLAAGAQFTQFDEAALKQKSEKQLQTITDDFEKLLNDALAKNKQDDDEGNDEGGQELKTDVPTPADKPSLDTELDKFMVQINKGVNVELTIAGKKQVFVSQQRYLLPENYAMTIIDEGLGQLIDHE